MGFGILFCGYLIAFNTVAYPGFTKIFSCLLMLLAMTKLGQYNRALKSAYYALIPTSVIAGLYFLLQVASMFSLIPETEEILLFRLIPLAVALFEAFFLFRLMRGLADIAKETEVPVLELAALRNRTLTTIYYGLYVLGQLDYGAEMTKFLIYYNVALLFVGFFIMFLNAKLFFGFYMWICLPEDVNMERKHSRIPFLDRLYEKMDEMEEKRLKRRQESDRAYREQKTEKKRRRKK
jgi:hypothetical protein